MQSAAVDFKYKLGTCLHEGDREAIYETEFEGEQAVIKFVRPENSLDEAKLISEFGRMDRVLDHGEAEVFDTHVVFAVTALEEEPVPAAVPLYRKHAVIAIGGVTAAAALCLLLVRNAEHKPAPPVPAPVVQQQVTAPAVQSPVPPPPQKEKKQRAHRKARHKKR